MSVIELIKAELRETADPEKAAFFPNYFKTNHLGGDKFLGVTVPKQRVIAKAYYQKLSLDEAIELLHGEWHEERLTALFILDLQFQKADENGRAEIVAHYLTHSGPFHSNILKNIRMKTGVGGCKICEASGNYQVNNWDLVDSSAYFILGSWLLDKDRSPLYDLAKSSYLWERRIAIVATMTFIRKGETQDTFKIAQMLLHDKEDYIHKAVGWLLREAGKKDQARLEEFLDEHAAIMPRTMLRYAIERLNPDQKHHYMQKK